MRALCMVVGVFASTAAVAQDVDQDGCDDARFTAEAACVHPTATVDPTVVLGADASVGQNAVLGAGLMVGAGVTIADYANVAGQGVAGIPSVLGPLTIVGRRVQLGSDAVIGAETVLGRSAVAGTDLHTGVGAVVGYGAQIGDHVDLGAGSAVGNLVTVGSWTTLGDTAVLARGSAVDGGSGDADRTVVNGVVGPEVRIGAGAQVSSGARIRKSAVIGAGAQITGSARIGRGVEIGPRAVVADSAVIRAGANICNDSTVPEDTYVSRGDTFPAEGCPCEPGFEGPPGACEDVDECSLGLDDCGAFTDCVNTSGAFQCDCQLGYVADVDGDCVEVDADITGGFGPDLTNQPPSSVLESSETVVVDGFDGALDVGVQTTGSGSPAVIQAFRGGVWQEVTSVVAGDEIRVQVAAPPGDGQSRTVTVTLFVGPTNVWVSTPWSLSTWSYSATSISYGPCSATCGGGSRSPISWSCTRSDGTSGHSQGNCSGGGSQSCNTQSCPFNARTNGSMVTIRDPFTSADRYDVTCRNGGNGDHPSAYTIMPPISVSANASIKEITVRIGNPGGREGWYRMRFSGSTNMNVSSFNPGASGRHPYMCKRTQTSVPRCNNEGGTVDPQNCSSYIFCRVQDRNSGAYIYETPLVGNRAIYCPGVTMGNATNLGPNDW